MHGFVGPGKGSIRLPFDTINSVVLMLANTECCGNDIECSAASEEFVMTDEEDVTIGIGVVVVVVV